MPARKDMDTAYRAAAGAAADTSAVERSLEEFIARANSTLPDFEHGDEGATRPKTLLADVKKRRSKKADPSTLVVLGSPAPLADVTEIVSRVAVGTKPLPPRRVLGVRLGAAFLAGAAAVLLVSRILVGGPEPQKPEAAPAVPAPVVTKVPVVTPIVEPIVTPEAAAAPAEAADPVETAAAAAVVVELPKADAKPEPRPARAKTTPPRPPRAKPEVKKSGSLVDPFAP